MIEPARTPRGRNPHGPLCKGKRVSLFRSVGPRVTAPIKSKETNASLATELARHDPAIAWPITTCAGWMRCAGTDYLLSDSGVSQRNLSAKYARGGQAFFPLKSGPPRQTYDDTMISSR